MLSRKVQFNTKTSMKQYTGKSNAAPLKINVPIYPSTTKLKLLLQASLLFFSRKALLFYFYKLMQVVFDQEDFFKFSITIKADLVFFWLLFE